MSKVVTIHQPEHLPWLGFFHKIFQADTVVLLDNVPFRKNYFQNRNKVRTATGLTWVTVPVKRHLDTKICDVEIAGERWKRKWWDTIYYNYKRSKFFEKYMEAYFWPDKLFDTLEDLSSFNEELIFDMCLMFDVETPEFISTERDMKVSGDGTDLLLDICEATMADTYLSGPSGRDYLELHKFNEADIEVKFEDFKHPVYKQLYEPFIYNTSAIDLLFNYGPDSYGILMDE